MFWCGFGRRWCGFVPFWYIAFDRRRCIVFVATAVVVFFRMLTVQTRLHVRDFQRERQWEDTTNNICSTQKRQHRTQQSHQQPQQNTVVIWRRRSETPFLSQYSSSTVWEVERRCHKKWNFQPPAAVWYHFFGVFVTSYYSCCNGASFDVGYVSVDPGEGELPSPES